MDLLNLPHNVKIELAKYLELNDKLNLSYTCKLMFNTLIPTIYNTIIYTNLEKSQIFRKSYDSIELRSDHFTLIHPSNISLFFKTLEKNSALGFSYSDMIQQLYLFDLTDRTQFDLIKWRSNPPMFKNLKYFQFPTSYVIDPLTFEQAPNLDKITIDENFCIKVEKEFGLINFIDVLKINKLTISGRLGKNEDMVIFKLLTTCPQLIKHLTELNFTVDEKESYERVYRRVVGFFAILRKMGLIMVNLKKIAIPLTNHSTSIILQLIGKHIYFENLTNLEIFIEDDGKVLNLVNSLQQLSSMLRSKGFNISQVSINYKLLKEDSDKNHLRALMLMKFMEPFKKLIKYELNLKIEGLDLSNLLMIIGTPINNNMETLRDVRLNIERPSENMIGNLLPALDDIQLLFPSMKYLNTCECELCQKILNSAGFTNSKDVVNESIKVSTLMIIGHELDQLQKSTFTDSPYYSSILSYKRFIKTGYNKDGYLFDHLLKNQLNELLNLMPYLKMFEICGLVYHSTSPGKFELLYGDEFKTIDPGLAKAMVDMSYLFSGDFNQIGEGGGS